MDSATLMQRQESLGLEIPENVIVVGCGGVGSWTAYFLALAGVPNIWLFDGDIISHHNLNRIPVSQEWVDQSKTMAIGNLIKQVRPDCMVYSMGRFTPEVVKNFFMAAPGGWVIATTDTLSSRRMVSEWAAKHGLEYIEASAEGEIGGATGMPAEWATPDEDRPGYASVPVWVGPCVSSALVAVTHVLHNTPMGDKTIRMGWKEGRFNVFDSEIEVVDEGNEETETAEGSHG
jgi:hypothetical protein